MEFGVCNAAGCVFYSQVGIYYITVSPPRGPGMACLQASPDYNENEQFNQGKCLAIIIIAIVSLGMFISYFIFIWYYYWNWLQSGTLQACSRLSVGMGMGMSNNEAAREMLRHARTN